MQTRLTAAKNFNARPDASRRRALVISAALALWMLAIGARLVHLQTSQHDWLSERARAQQQGEAETSPARGLILDREGRELARSAPVESFFADPSEIQEVAATAARLAPLVGADRAELAGRLQTAKAAGRRFVWLARKLDAERSAAITALGFSGIHRLKETKRVYPNGSLAAHVLGFVGTDQLGLGGVEQFHNASLTGEAGKVFVETDGQRRAYRSYETSPRPGQTLVLTIDQTVQYYAEQAIAEALRTTRARAATAVVLEPHTGEILALVNAPSFDPNEAHKVTPALRTNEALQNIYEPGSTFKIVAYSAALEEQLARPEERVDCQMGSITVAGRVVRDHHPYGSLTLIEALAKSSNVAAIKMGLRVGDARMYEYIRRFGFGGRTGVELPGETAGLLRPVARWQASSIGSIAIGQEIGVTPVQIAAAFATLANDGVRVAPHLVRETRKADGSIATRAAPEERRVVSAETARRLRGMLESVTLAGTAKSAQLDGYTAAGKTGTAQKIDPRTRAYSKTKYVASFVGFAPVEKPAVVIAVVIDEPAGAYHGGQVAAPIFRQIAEKILPALSVAPDTDFDESQGPAILLAQAATGAGATMDQPSHGAQSAGLPEVISEAGREAEVVFAATGARALSMPDLRGRSIRDVARVCAQLGLRLEARGEGRAVEQYPATGAEVEAGQAVRVDFARND